MCQGQAEGYPAQCSALRVGRPGLRWHEPCTQSEAVRRMGGWYVTQGFGVPMCMPHGGHVQLTLVRVATYTTKQVPERAVLARAGGRSRIGGKYRAHGAVRALPGLCIRIGSVSAADYVDTVIATIVKEEKCVSVCCRDTTAEVDSTTHFVLRRPRHYPVDEVQIFVVGSRLRFQRACSGISTLD